MKFAYMSDMHFEFGRSQFLGVLPEADYLLLAGDMKAANECARYDSFMSKAREQYGDGNVLMIDGNHTGYGGSINDFSNHQIVTLADDILIICATLWSGSGSKMAYRCLNDGVAIAGFSWNLMYERHLSDLTFIEENILKANSKGLKTVVMTHHMPHWQGITDTYKRQGKTGVNLGFYTDLDYTIENLQPDVWVCGHTHDSFDIKVHNTRILCNPRGYPQGLQFENAKFDPLKTFEL